ncbi:MAG: hypothetical protein JWN16_467 [Alphaproteobacteria bacterium]|jgi:hypothetical protein|nr:hypothetical protein [Alphaproteobacteria bacterium]
MKLRLFAAIFACVPLAAQAQDAPLKFSYRFGTPGTNHWRVDGVLHAVADQAGVILEPRIGPDMLVIAISGEIEQDKGEHPKGFRFMLGFTRDGDRLGESWEDCNSDMLADCVRQVTDDIRSADAIHH